MSDPKPAAARTWAIRIAVGLVVSGLIVAALLSQGDVDQVAGVLLRVRADFVAIAFGLYLAILGLRTLRLRLLIPDARASTLFAVNAVHLLLLRIMPMRTGEIAFAWLMNRSGAASFEKS